MEEVFYRFPDGTAANIAARACMEATNEMPSVTRYLYLKIEIEEGRDLRIPRKAAEKLLKKFGGEMYGMLVKGAAYERAEQSH